MSIVSGDTHLAANWKLKHTRSTNNLAKNFYFNRFPRLWNTLPFINITSHPAAIKQKVYDLTSGTILYVISVQQMHVATLLSAAVPVVVNCQLLPYGTKF